MNEDKRTVEEILELLDECLRTGLWFEINKDDTKTLKEYIETQNKELGRERIKNGIRKNDNETLARKIDEYEKILQEIDVEGRRKKSRELQEKIDQKTSEICKYKRKIEYLRREVISVMEFLGIEVYD